MIYENCQNWQWSWWELCLDLWEASEKCLETPVKEFCMGGTSKKWGNGKKIEPNSHSDLILGSFPRPKASLSALAWIWLLPEKDRISLREAYIFVSHLLTFTKNRRNEIKFQPGRVFEISWVEYISDFWIFENWRKYSEKTLNFAQ